MKLKFKVKKASKMLMRICIVDKLLDYAKWMCVSLFFLKNVNYGEACSSAFRILSLAERILHDGLPCMNDK